MNPDFKDLFSELSAAEARWLLVGGYATMHYSVPRYTKDLDVWVEPTEENARKIHRALARFGAPMGDLRIADLATPGTIFQIGVAPNRIDVLTAIEGLVFAEAWDRRTNATYGGVPIYVVGLEDLMTNKRAVGRPQDLLDVKWLEQAKARGR